MYTFGHKVLDDCMCIMCMIACIWIKTELLSVGFIKISSVLLPYYTTPSITRARITREPAYNAVSGMAPDFFPKKIYFKMCWTWRKIVLRNGKLVNLTLIHSSFYHRKLWLLPVKIESISWNLQVLIRYHILC